MTKVGLGVGLVAGLGLLVCGLAMSTTPGVLAGDPPPLVVDEDAPLLLDEPDAAQRKVGKGAADNSACFVCHVNYQKEPLASVHAREGIGCVKCHGDSFAHRNDENNITPPDIMFARALIDRSCQDCHKTHDVPARDVIAAFQNRCPKGSSPESVVCTDCHGQHRLKLRSVRWDKRTGKLLGDPAKK